MAAIWEKKNDEPRAGDGPELPMHYASVYKRVALLKSTPLGMRTSKSTWDEQNRGCRSWREKIFGGQPKKKGGRRNDRGEEYYGGVWKTESDRLIKRKKWRSSYASQGYDKAWMRYEASESDCRLIEVPRAKGSETAIVVHETAGLSDVGHGSIKRCGASLVRR